MESKFWHDKWEAGEIGFHQAEVNTLLIKHLPALDLAPGSRLFVPLCGKTLDIGWLLDTGYRVVGAELSELAIKELFENLGIEPTITSHSGLLRYRGSRTGNQNVDQLEVFVGDIFDLTSDLLGPVDAVYDRAALVALPQLMRDRYTKHMIEITASAPQLLLSFEYDQSLIDGPPFSLDTLEIKRQYAGTYHLKAAEIRPVDGGLKGKIDASETAWLLT